MRTPAIKRSRRRLTGVVLAASLLGAACSGSGSTASDTAAGAGADAAETPAAAVSLASFELPTVDGGQLTANDIEGKDTVLWFWAPW